VPGPYPYRTAHEPVRRIVEAFGPSRVFWGSDLTRLPCTYSECVTMFTEELDFLTDEGQAQIMGRAVCDWLGWPLTQPAPTH
jgi:predicted TIM-barrel fold metal-dependent hydrolase